MKKCSKCKEEIAEDAKKCKHCGADQRNWFIRHKILTGVLGLIVLIIIISAVNGGGGQKNMTADNGTTQDKPQTQFIKIALGAEITTKTYKLTVNSAQEKPTINSTYGTPKTAATGAKFVIVNMDVTNLTNDKYIFNPNDTMSLVDSNSKKFKTYENTIGNIDDYLDFQDLSPSIVKKGVVVYEIPQATSIYDLFVENPGTNDIYQVKIK